ncbi:MAG: hypothetical protein VZR00_00390 [Lachnospiraceae bacterium]|jgi:RNA polymerase subunit RPABC4/transcription elongation factor Spt4|nr:hypothetical protein [Lachnospiraceae bacterium]MEE3460334.1 hypothetical protein [Lachnospiraceae bacterium]
MEFRPEKKMNKVKMCRVCGRILPDGYQKDICIFCEENELFDQIRDYIRKNDVDERAVADHFNIPVGKVKRWIREGRIEYKNEKIHVSNDKVCRICGKPVLTGDLCPQCEMLQKVEIIAEAKKKKLESEPKKKHNGISRVDSGLRINR